MDEKVQWLRGQIEDWKENKIIDKRTANRILSFYSDQKPVEHKNKTPLILSVIAAILISAGLISLIAYNWIAIGRGVKTAVAFVVAMLPALLIFIPMAAPEKFKILDKAIIKEFISFLWVVMCGASMEFLAQIYLLPLSWEELFLLWFAVSLLILFCTRCKGVYALTVVLFVCASYSYLGLSLVVCVFFLYSNYLLKNNQKYDNVVYPLLFSLLAVGYLALLITERNEVLICTVTKTPYMKVQAVLLIVGSITGLVHVILSARKIGENKKLLINVVESVTLFFCLTAIMLYGCFAKVDISFFQPFVQIVLMTLLLSGTARVIYFNNKKWIPFIASGLISSLNISFDFLSKTSVFGPFLIFILICFAEFLQNKNGRKKTFTNKGKIIFAFALFIGIFEIYNVSKYSYSYYRYEYRNPILDQIVLNFSMVYLFVFGIIRPLLVSIKNKKTVNYVMPVYSAIIFVYLILIQIGEEHKIAAALEIVMPYVALIAVVVFSVIEIIYLLKKNSIVGINLYAVYLLFVTFIKFFMTTESLIFRGVAFILCGVIVLVINIILSKCLKTKEGKNEN